MTTKYTKFFILLITLMMGLNAWADDVYYEQCTDVSDIKDGGSYVIVISDGGTNYYAIQHESTNYVKITPESDGTLKNPDSLVVWLAGSTTTENGFTFRCSSSAYNNDYIYCDGSKTYISTVGSKSATWVVSKLSVGTNTFKIQLASTTGRYIGWSGSDFKAYTSSNFKNQFESGVYFGQYSGVLYIYKVKDSAPTYTPTTLNIIAYDTNKTHWATFSNDDVTFIPTNSNSVEVKKVSAIGNILTMKNLDVETAKIDNNDVSGYFVPASTGVLIKSKGSDTSTQQITYYTVKNKSIKALSDNCLYPGTGNVIVSPDNCYYYKLAYDNYSAKTGLGFYWGAANGGAYNVSKGLAYLAISKSSSSKGGFAFTDVEDIVTGVSGVSGVSGNEKVVFNLMGQRVERDTKGLVIINGRKVVSK